MCASRATPTLRSWSPSKKYTRKRPSGLGRVMPMSPLNTPRALSLRVTMTGRPAYQGPSFTKRLRAMSSRSMAVFRPVTPQSPSRTAHSRRKRSNACKTCFTQRV